MLVTPVPVSFLFFFQPVKLPILAVVFLHPDAIGPILVLVPFVFVEPMHWLSTGRGIAMAVHLGLAATTLAYALFGFGLSHLLLMGNATDFTSTPLAHLADDGMFRHFRPIFRGTLIANVNMDAERGNRLIGEGLADLVAFGRPYIANPDLVERLMSGAPLADVDWTSVYAAGPHGYTDYPSLSAVPA